MRPRHRGWHHHHHHARWHRSPVRFVRSRLRRRLFVWFGVSILLSGMAAGAIAWSTSSRSDWHRQVESVEGFVGRRFAEVWDDPARRDTLAREFPRELSMNVTLVDARGDVLASFDDRCDRPDARAPVFRDGRRVGEARLCYRDTSHRGPFSFFAALAGFGLVLWMAAGFVSRRLTRPLDQLVTVARDIGDGKLSARMKLGRHTTGELHELAVAINEMAARIQKQLEDQKSSSPPCRTRSAHRSAMHACSSRWRETAAPTRRSCDELEREVLEVDTLVDQLLASSRLEFDAIDARPLDLAGVARTALERAGLDPSLLVVEGDPALLRIEADPTLLSRALGNLIDNAKRHAGDVAQVRVRREGPMAIVEVEDEGPGLAPEDLERVFDRFYRGERRAGAKRARSASASRWCAGSRGPTEATRSRRTARAVARRWG